jgi:PAS domain S-box-containing protein
MVPRKPQPGKKKGAAGLRRQAEAEWTERKKKTGPLPASEADLKRLMHELEVHQIELEMQNEELTQARAETEKALRYYNDLYDFAPAGYFTLARDGTVRQVNLAGARLLGVERKGLMKLRFGLFVSDESRQVFNAFLERVFECREEETCEVVLRRDGHGPRWVHIEASCAEGGEECCAVLVDITERKNTQVALSETEYYFRTLVDTINEGLSVFDEKGKFSYVNDRFCEMLGYAREELIGSSHLKVIPQERRERHEQIVAERKQGKSRVYETVFKRKDNSAIPVLLAGSPLFDRDGNYAGAIGASLDISERVKLEQELHENEARYRALFENINSGVAVYEVKDNGRDFIFKDFNRAGEKIDQDQRERLIGKSVFEVRPGAEQFGLINVFRKVWQTGKPAYHPVTQYQDKLLTGWYDNYVYKLPSGDIVAVFQNITERKRVEEALRTSEAQLSNALQMACASHWEYDVGSDTFTFNDNFYRIFRTTAEKVGGYKMSSADYARRFCHPDDMAIVSKETKAAIESTDPNYNRQLEHRILYADGEVGYITVRFFIVKDSQGRTVKTYGVNQDITARVREEEKLRASDALLRTVLSNAPITIFATDNQGVFTLSEGKGLERVGLSPGENVGVSALDLFASKSFVENTGRITTGQDVIQRVLAGETVNAIDELNGVYFDNHISPIHGAEGEVIGIVGVATDITERVRAEKTVQQSEELLRTVLTNINDPVFLTDNDGEITYICPDTTRALGYTLEEIQTMGNIAHLIGDSVFDPEDLERSGKLSNIELPVVDKFGEQKIFLVTVKKISIQEGRRIYTLHDITERVQAEKDILKSNRRLSEAQALTHTGNYEFEVSDGIVLWSQETYHIIARDPALGPPSVEEYMAMVHPQDREVLSRAVAGALASWGTFDIQYRVLLPDGAVKHIRSLGRAQKADSGKDRIIGTLMDVSEQVQVQQEVTALLDSVTQQREELRLLAARISEVAETERRLIAAELHDQVGQSLTAMNINLNILRGQLPESATELVQRVDDTLQLVDQTAVRIRDLMTQLRPSVLDDYGLYPALEVAAEQFTQRTGVPVNVSRQPAGGEIVRLSTTEETALFRIVQEALVNCARHAGASQIKITLKMLKNKLRLIIADNGHGFDPEESDRSKENGGWGLRIMRERAQAVGARLQVESSPGEGTTVKVELKV